MKRDGITTCLICGAPLNAEGICLAINEPFHSDLQSDYPPTLDELDSLEGIE